MKNAIMFLVGLVITAIIIVLVIKGDTLAYYGAVLGGIATLLAVIITVLDGDKKRNNDKLESENRERYNNVSSLFFDTLNNLNCSYLSDFKIDFDIIWNLVRTGERQAKFVDLFLAEKLPELIEKANKCKILDIYLSSNEKEIFSETLKILDKYRERYTSFLHRLIRYYYDSDKSVTGVFDEMKSLYSTEYDKLVESVRESLKKFERLGR
jgi:hypothetical protein